MQFRKEARGATISGFCAGVTEDYDIYNAVGQSGNRKFADPHVFQDHFLNW